MMGRIVGIDENKLVFSRVDLDKIKRGALEKIFVVVGDQHINPLGNKVSVVLASLVKPHAIDKTAVVLASYGNAQIKILRFVLLRRSTDLVGGLRRNFDHVTFPVKIVNVGNGGQCATFCFRDTR